MKKMTMIAGALSLALMTAQTQADNNEMCNFQLDYDLTVENSAITFVKDSGTEITIDQDNQLFFNGTKKSLDSNQQQLIDNYADGVRDLIPEVTAIAIEGVNLGVQAASMALRTLLGEGDADFERFNYKISELAESITMKLDANNFSSKQLEEAFDNEFEQEIEDIVEQAVTELTPRLIAKVLTAAMSGDEAGITDFEERANAIEHEVENFVEPKAEALEARADELCGSIEGLDVLETKMVESGLEMMDLITKDQDGYNHKSSGKHFNFNLGD